MDATTNFGPADVLEEANGVRRLRLCDGVSEGVEVVELSLGETTCVVCPTRGMGLLSMRACGVDVGWKSPVRGPVHPALVNLNSRGGLGWLDGFSELLARCGLAFNGPPGVDEAAGAVGESVTLHGRVANTPAREVRVQSSPDRVSVSGVVDEATVFGSRLEMRSEVAVTATGAVEVRDVVVNRGGREADVQLIYHVNVGPPILGEGSQIRVSATDACPRDARAAEGAAGWSVCEGPTAGFAEQAYYFKAASGADGEALATLHNPDSGLSFGVSFQAAELPCVTVWKCTQAEADGYVVGLEPGTNFPNFKADERSRGRVRRLPPGGTLSTGVTLRLNRGESPGVWPEAVMRPEPAEPMAVTADE